MIQEFNADKIGITKGYLFWVGLETGEIVLCGFMPESNTIIEVSSIDKVNGHSKSINRIRQQRGAKNTEDRKKLIIATCSDDCSARIYSFNF